jgi:hypothetical protein
VREIHIINGLTFYLVFKMVNNIISNLN